MSDPSNNKIRNSIDDIEPTDGAKDRMLKNIRQKAAMQQEVPQPVQPEKNAKTAPYKRIVKWVMPVAACFVLLIVGSFIPGILNSTPPDLGAPAVQALPPFVAADSSQELTELLGIEVDAPVGAGNVQYSILDGEIAQISFTWNGQEFFLRASEQDGDFSGVNGTESAPELIDAEADAQYSVISEGEIECGKISWTNGRIRFYLTSSGERPEECKEVYKLIK